MNLNHQDSHAVSFWVAVPFLVTVLAVMSGCGGDGEPQLSIESHVIDFGRIPEDGKDLLIPIVNSGSGTLRIVGVETSCSCVIAEVPKTIGPGERASVVIRPPSGTPGSTSAKLFIRSNAADSPHEIMLSWFGDSPPRLIPSAMNNQNLIPGEEFEQQFIATYSGGDARYPLEIKEVRVFDPRISVQELRTESIAKVSKKDALNARAVVGETTFSVRCRLPDRSIHLKGLIEIDAVQAGTSYHLVLPVNLKSVGSIYSSNGVFFSSNTSESLLESHRHVLVFTRHSASPPLIKKCPQFLKCKIALQAEDVSSETTRWLLDVQIEAVPPSSEAEGDVVLEHPSTHEVLRVPYRVFIAEEAL